MPLRRNRRQYEQLTDFDRAKCEAGWLTFDWYVARCWQQWITEGRVYRRGGSGREHKFEDRAIRRVATSAPTTSLASIQRHLPPFQTSSAIKRNHENLEEPTSAKTLTTDPNHRQCRLDFWAM
ncbi:hypothetical protein TNCV_1486271 [Trichonephila clavipes]|nr:hypothetical protein TNCV_1486271 [Trichonephila clavipes]